jgi:hypothetical protein
MFTLVFWSLAVSTNSSGETWDKIISKLEHPRDIIVGREGILAGYGQQ